MDELIPKIQPMHLKENISCILTDNLTCFPLLNKLKLCVKSNNCSYNHPSTTPIKLYTFLKKDRHFACTPTRMGTYTPNSRCYCGFHVSIMNLVQEIIQQFCVYIGTPPTKPPLEKPVRQHFPHSAHSSPPDSPASQQLQQVCAISIFPSPQLISLPTQHLPKQLHKLYLIPVTKDPAPLNTTPPQ